MDHRTSIGFDVHARSIKAAAFTPDTGEVAETSLKSAAEVVSWAAGLPGPVKAVYESGPTGFGLARQLAEAEVPCVVGATSKMLRSSGDRVKTDSRDAVWLARMLAVENIVEVRIPASQQEVARDVTRMRESAREELTRAKLMLTRFLLRKGYVYSDGKTWTYKYRAWIAAIGFEDLCEQFVFEGHLAAVAAAEQRKARLQEKVEELAAGCEQAQAVRALSCLRGVNTYTAFAICVGIGDFSRFPTARSLMAYLGLVPSESSSGESASRGPMTNTGNGHVRKMLIESAWHNLKRYNPTSVTMMKAFGSAPPEAAAIADKANRRLHEKYVGLKQRGKNTCLTNAAVAREMAGWIWALANAVG